ncbi:MerR family transcriptional regulator [Beutenbergia cavernae]|uniref:transcriptional regulator FtsR n=1 Tax=Beutenbergia cavernae TaxID=84757 RepID=UPI0002F19B2D|nr:MerR family transcriptional regulator [Beutenbergia cavernae]
MPGSARRSDESPGAGDDAPVVAEPWPRGVSRNPTMNIGAVLAVLKREFPAVSHSKLRFLEDQGLVAPRRTPAGYRVFCQADVERLRFALAAQRDSFLPLRVIRERLAELDSGAESAPEARLASADGELTGALPRGRLHAAELAELTGVTVERVGELASAGLISADAAGRYPSAAVAIVQLAQDLGTHGIDTRHLRLMRAAADRQVDVVAQIVAPLRGHGNAQSAAVSRERATAVAGDLTELLSRLHGALVRAGVERLT